MDIIRVEGGHAIGGSVPVSGAKNSALKLMAATLLAPGKTTLQNVPDISDVHVMGKALRSMFSTSTRSRLIPLRSILGRPPTSSLPRCVLPQP